MLKTFQFRLYPTRKQAHALEQWLDECRWLYNHFLAERRDSWEEHSKPLNYHKQAVSLPKLKRDRMTLNGVHSQVLQNVAVRIDLAFKAFFRRVKAGEKPGYPRFRGQGRYDSFTFPQYPSGCSLKDGTLYVSKIGHIKLVLHRPLEGTPKTVTIRRTATGKWFATFSCEGQPRPLPESDEAIGIDLGLTAFATLSTGEKIDHPQFVRQEGKALAKVQRARAKQPQGTPIHDKRRKVVARVHERIAWKRQDFIHQHSRRMVNRFGVIAIEDLSVNQMVHNPCLAKSILDAAWSGFGQLVRVKAAWAGRAFVAVNPAYTSQDCHRCGHRQPMPLSERTFACPCCGLVLDRDHNAALNILRLGLQSLGSQPLEAPAFTPGE